MATTATGKQNDTPKRICCSDDCVECYYRPKYNRAGVPNCWALFCGVFVFAFFCATFGMGCHYSNEAVKFASAVEDYCTFNADKSPDSCSSAFDSTTCGNDDNILIEEDTCGRGAYIHDHDTCYVNKSCDDFSWTSPEDSLYIALILYGVALIMFILMFMICYGWFKCWVPYRHIVEERMSTVGASDSNVNEKKTRNTM